MALNKKTYVNGQTVITAQNLNEIQDAIIELENAPSGGGTWGSITGTLSDQTDLNAALAAKQSTIDDLATIRSNASDAESKAHEHSNKSILDATTASFTTETANTISTHSANIVALQNLTNTFYRDAQGYLCER